MSLLKKLRIDTEKPLWLINAPEEYRHLFEGAELKTKLAGKMQIGQVVFFAEDSVKLNGFVDNIEARVDLDSLIWVAYPKKRSKLESDLSMFSVWDYLYTKFNGVASAAIDDTWTGMRFKKKDPNKPSGWIPMEERKTEGVDYINRTVTLPPDAVKAMKPYKGLEVFFYGMSFSHTREYIESIADAKKPETRKRRIEGMITKVLALKEAKEAKAAAKTKK
ncbi:MAG TPA: YdeI/OmpD-associated family protein [Flavipsychrobacter sp.]|nr:YdeI/OmpD-associated family protein [Flavipsychrobacter sp.]